MLPWEWKCPAQWTVPAPHGPCCLECWLQNCWVFLHLRGLPSSSAGEESACNAVSRPWFDSWVRKVPWRREWLPTPVFWPDEFQGLYTLWSCRVRHNWATFTSLHFSSFISEGVHRGEQCSPHPFPNRARPNVESPGELFWAKDPACLPSLGTAASCKIVVSHFASSSHIFAVFPPFGYSWSSFQKSPSWNCGIFLFKALRLLHFRIIWKM